VVSRKKYETHHSSDKDDAIIAAVELSQRYTNRFLPDKTIDLMDEAASKYAWKSIQNQKNWTFWIEK
jgi:ATP-dependent Clp protease ATP-binding subunit ClpB